MVKTHATQQTPNPTGEEWGKHGSRSLCSFVWIGLETSLQETRAFYHQINYFS
jgi:hypothetical protein